MRADEVVLAAQKLNVFAKLVFASRVGCRPTAQVSRALTNRQVEALDEGRVCAFKVSESSDSSRAFVQAASTNTGTAYSGLRCTRREFDAIMSFATGSSWGSFAIMLPLVIPLAHSLELALPVSIGAVLAGGLFGDHASPISDTTILSSTGAGSDHIDHVRTQMPYCASGGGLEPTGLCDRGRHGERVVPGSGGGARAYISSRHGQEHSWCHGLDIIHEPSVRGFLERIGSREDSVGAIV